jgi:hypothetical protein
MVTPLATAVDDPVATPGMLAALHIARRGCAIFGVMVTPLATAVDDPVATLGMLATSHLECRGLANFGMWLRHTWRAAAAPTSACRPHCPWRVKAEPTPTRQATANGATG